MADKILATTAIIAVVVVGYLQFFSRISATEYRSKAADLVGRFIPLPKLDTTDYDRRLLRLAHIPLSTTTSPSAQVSSAPPGRLYPVKAP